MQDNRIPKPMTEAEILRRRELRRAAIKKQKRRRTLFLTACGRTEGSPHNESIYGSFAMSDKSCVYTFREDGSGELRLSGGSQYEFNYTLKDDTLSIDFKSSAVTDSKYTVAFKSDGITLTAAEGTISPGIEYKLNKMP